VGQEHIKDFGDPFIPERVYNAWKRNKDFELMKVCGPANTVKLTCFSVGIKRMLKSFSGYY